MLDLESLLFDMLDAIEHGFSPVELKTFTRDLSDWVRRAAADPALHQD
ncbi:DUF935 domain-containing protein [Serratia symbiotica]|nr:DUF935 domain-containing protein [Serratia symbiotica]